jgi:hypothetical protein
MTTAVRTPTTSPHRQRGVKPLAAVLEMVWAQVDLHALGGWTRLEDGALQRLGCDPAGLARLARFADATVSGGEVAVELGGRRVVFSGGAA